ncbi:MAG TPA: adenylate/guanylate cyclase domain-containing protein [Acetobacteraceae bacterium]|nr:adenylate/guanylate cyclase domain-containing protein [Acetobacteraceae bacterium]
MPPPAEEPAPPEQDAGRRSIRRRLAAILGVDIRNYSILMAASEEDAHRRVNAATDRLVREIHRSHGRAISRAGDGLMAEFPSAVEALKCALRVQADAGRRNARLPPEQRIEYRMGINSGEIVLQRGRIGGNAIIIAARLEQIADAGGIFISGTVYEQVNGIVMTTFDRLGERRLKNVRQPVLVYRIAPDTCLSWNGMPAVARREVRHVQSSAEDYRPSLAVLPFRTLQEDRSDAYFAEGMVDDIIRLLGGLKELLVIARSSTLGFAGSPLDLRRVGHELDVRYVLHGSLRRAADRLRIAVELCEAETGHLIWADRLDGELADLFDLQDRIAMRVVGAVAPNVRERELNRSMRKHPSSMTAYDLTLQAFDQLYRMDHASFFRARELLREALAHDPSYAPAHSYSAYWHIFCVGQGWSQDVAGDTRAAAEAAQAAVRLDRNDALGLAFAGHMQSYLMKDYTAAMDLLDRALAAGPSSAWAHSMSSFTCGYVGDLANCLVRAETAVRLSPLGPDAFMHEHVLAQAHYLAARYDEAIAWSRMSIAHCATQTSTLRCLTASLVAAGNLDEARHVARQHAQLSPGFRLATFRALTPLQGDVRDRFAARLLAAGLPE